MLERYEESSRASDLALELPTGTGKTLIGLLIAEWRRRSFGERVLYLCPTRQLVHQVSALASRYGIGAVACLQPDYEGLERWNRSDAIAISTYSALFNYRSRFNAPQALVLDDAHAAEGYVSSHWTLTIDRETMSEAYRLLATLLGGVVDGRVRDLMADGNSGFDRGSVDLVPLPRWWPLADEVRDLLDEAVEGTDQFFAWDHHIREGLSGCNLLVSRSEVVLRPLIPTTRRQGEFDGAAQRIYMSATLGAGGELERIFGVRRIERIPVPDEWEQHSTGRRLFLLPAASLPGDEMNELVADAASKAGRSLVLTPTKEDADRRCQRLEAKAIPTLTSNEIEESLEPFTSRDPAALVLANRYDGIDLPGDDCRLVILDGLPVAVNPLERFLHQRLSATSLLSERMRTRFTQGVGRATRGEGDWCAVMIGSREAYDFCARTDVRELLHPELQGELQFGLAQSEDREAPDFLELLEVLLEHGEEWEEAEAEIRALRDQSRRGVDPSADALNEVVSSEVDFTYAMSETNYPRALELARATADALGGDEVASYRAWWLYQAGAAAWMAAHSFSMDGMEETARELFKRAASTGRSVHWFADLAYGEVGEEADLSVSRADSLAAERVQRRLRRIGFFGNGLTKRASLLTHSFEGTDSDTWEEGLRQLGDLLGFESRRPDGQNAPDSTWSASEHLAIVWEAKSDENPDGEIGARTVQQAAGHERWIREHGSLGDDADVLPLLVSDRRRLGEGAELHADDVCLVSLDSVREISVQTIAALRRIRAVGKEGDDLALRDQVIEVFRNEGLLVTQMADRLGRLPLSDLS